jgi:hypothetical protein
LFNYLKLFLIFFFALSKGCIFAAPAWIDLPADDYSRLARFEDARFETLNSLVEKYQSIPKSTDLTLKNRMHALQDVSDFLSIWIDHETFGVRRSFLTNIKKIADGKKWYLTELDARCTSGHFETDYLKTYHYDLSGLNSKYKSIYLVHERHYDSHNGMYWGEFWFETIDPLHRQLTPYYDLWVKQNGKEENLLSFFMWLEDQNLPKDVPFIEFLNEQQLSQCTVIVEDGLLYLPSNGQKILVDYNQEDEEYIFNIDLSEHLLLMPASKKIHHISFSHGKPVLGAGNMTVNKGKISSIQLESGHYLPTFEQGMQILAIFNDLGISIEPTVPFTYYDNLGKHKTTIGELQCAFN